MTGMAAKEATLKHQLNAGVEAVLEVLKQAEKRIKVSEESKRELEAMQDRVRKHAEAAKSRIKLNVGGKSFHTCKSTLLAAESSYFSGMLGSGDWQPDDDGAYFIDRNPKMFGAVLDYLRTGELDIMGLPADKLKLLKNDFDYYCLTWPTKAHLVRWDKTVDRTCVTYDEAGLSATKTGGADTWDASTISETPTPAFKVLVRNRGANGYVMVGFIEKSTFTAGGYNYANAGARCCYLSNGR